MTSLIFLLSLLIAQQPGNSEFGTLSGQIRDMNGAPTAGVRVAVTPVGVDIDPFQAPTTLSNISQTDSNGLYRLQNVLPGRYLIVAGRVASPSYYPGVPTAAEARIITVAAGDVISDLNFVPALPLVTVSAIGGGLSGIPGSVQVDDGSSVTSGVVRSSSGPLGVRIKVGSVVSAVVALVGNGNGEFRLGLGAVGSNVTLGPLPLGYYLKSMTIGNLDLTTAPLALPPGPNNAQIQIVLTRTRPASVPPGFKVTGRVTNLGVTRDTLLRLIAVAGLGPNGSEQLTYAAPVQLTEDGAFELADVPQGRYRLYWGAQYLPFDVASTDLSNLEMTIGTAGTSIPLNLSSKSSLHGTVEVAERAIPQFEVGLVPTLKGAQTLFVTTVTGKEFSISVPVGEYQVSVSGVPEGYVLESVRAGPLDLTAPFLVTEGGIADRFTGNPILIRSGGSTPAKAGIAIRLKTAN